MKMSDLFNDGIVLEALAVLIGVLILGIFGWLKFTRDKKIASEILKKSGVETAHTSRATHAIPSTVQPSKDSNRQVSSTNDKNKRDKKEKES